eukprot:CAMPEP_0172046190 /NCGR_PEP_ID=MMETSP1043-20130122/281_1 /TAXON_ID=464988 /ORGANISM="Hemiselmis andersenii, Strain CCMP441" /LENGTH=173 /DNA_ID=CAMNT_0012704837 /DNA_START=475 /DNA_END=993 /DNA_ORIENTATION=+
MTAEGHAQDPIKGVGRKTPKYNESLMQPRKKASPPGLSLKPKMTVPGGEMGAMYSPGGSLVQPASPTHASGPLPGNEKRRISLMGPQDHVGYSSPSSAGSSPKGRMSFNVGRRLLTLDVPMPEEFVLQGGVGLELREVRGDGLEVVRVVPGLAADRTGNVRQKDLIVKINDRW